LTHSHARNCASGIKCESIRYDAARHGDPILINNYRVAEGALPLRILTSRPLLLSVIIRWLVTVDLIRSCRFQRNGSSSERAYHLISTIDIGNLSEGERVTSSTSISFYILRRNSMSIPIRFPENSRARELALRQAAAITQLLRVTRNRDRLAATRI